MPITAYNVKTKEKGVVMQNPVITQTKKRRLHGQRHMW